MEPNYISVPAALVSEALSTLGWERSDLDDSIPPAKAYAGARHLILAVADANRLSELDYDFDSLKALMHREGLTTLQLVWRELPDVFHSRNPFPVGGVVEDPAESLFSNISEDAHTARKLARINLDAIK